MTKYLLLLLTVFGFHWVKAQTPVIINQPYDFQKWIKVKDSLRAARITPDSTLQLPTGCGIPSGTASLKGADRKKSAIYRDSCGKKTYIFEPSDSTWSTVGGNPAGSNTQVQYNDNGALGGDAGLTYNATTNTVVTDSVRAKTVQSDEYLMQPLKDTLMALKRRGELRFDTTTNKMYYRENGRWRSVNDLTNQLVPNCPDCRIGTAIVRPNLSGTTVTWGFVVDPQHDSLFFTGVSCVSNNVVLSTPTVSKIYTVLVVPDEVFAAAGIDFGCSVTTTSAQIQFNRRVGTYAGYLQGNGTTYTKSAGATNWSTDYNSSFGWIFASWTNPASNQDAATAQYVGTNGYHAIRQFAGLAGYQMSWTIRDPFGGYVTDLPTSEDVVSIVTGDYSSKGINVCIASDPWSQGIFGAAFANLWVIAVYRL